MREKFKNKYRTDSVRLKYWNYSWSGGYFITICVKNRKCVFGRVIKGEMVLNNLGKIAHKCWKEIPDHFDNVFLDVFVVMPNHVHGIIILKNKKFETIETLHATSVRLEKDKKYSKISPKSKSLSAIIRSYKSACTNEINKKNPYLGFQWQPKYYDHIIRNERALRNIQNYIHNNPQKWKNDERSSLDLK